jgi:chromosome segregation ATPase
MQKSSFAQLRAAAASPNQQRVAKFLQEAAQRVGSRVLSALAARASADPFVKVKKMIKDLLIRLAEEANEEAEHKGWCDTELSTNEQTRKEKTAAVETLTAEIDELEASIAKLSDEITDLTKGVADLDAAMAEATELRTAEKAKNTETIADAKAAQSAVEQALAVVKEFYAKAGEATSLMQQKRQEPEIFDDKPYQGMGGDAGGVVGFLEVIQTDFARLESDTAAAEESAQTQYDEFMTDSKTDKTEKSTDLKHKESKKQDQTETLTTKKEERAGTQDELDAALAYFDKLKPTCVSTGNTYEDRVARRKEEIESLQEALKILSGESI